MWKFKYMNSTAIFLALMLYAACGNADTGLPDTTPTANLVVKKNLITPAAPEVRAKAFILVYFHNCKIIS